LLLFERYLVRMTTVPKQSLVGRAILALALLAGFYLLAAAIVGTMITLTIVSLSSGRIQIRLILATVIVTYAVIRGVAFTGKEARQPPFGLRIDHREPKLVSEVKGISEQMHTSMPDEIYLVHDVNAFVQEGGSMMGLRPGTRYMGIGLGLLNVVSVDQLRGILAHEFGHYTGGDTRLGGVVYRTYESILRTLRRLGSNLFGAIFRGYLKMFLRLTSKVRRQQELTADEAAARIGGRDAQIQALRAVVTRGEAYGYFIESYVNPLLEAGSYPSNIYEGFRSFLADPQRIAQLEEANQAASTAVTDPYDSHPALAERISYVSSLPPSDVAPDLRPALELLVDPDAIEKEMSAFLAGHANGGNAGQPIEWSEASAAYVTLYGNASKHFLDAAQRAINRQADLKDLLDLIETGKSKVLAQHAVEEFKKIPKDRQEEVIQAITARALFSSVASALVERLGYAWSMSWSGPAQLIDASSEKVPLDAWIESALAGPEGVAEVRRQLRERGLEV
jgi:Zn-dependent protease with chaperone function